MAYPPVVIVDKKDNPLGTAMLKDARAQGLLYRVIAIAVTDDHGRILLQKRASNMEIDPGKWDISVGGHVDEGQTYESAAQLELKEELGITDVHPEEFGKEFLGDRFLMLHTVTIPGDTHLTPGKDEVADTKWFTQEEFDSLLRNHTGQCADFLKEIYARAPSLFGVELAAARA